MLIHLSPQHSLRPSLTHQKVFKSHRVVKATWLVVKRSWRSHIRINLLREKDRWKPKNTFLLFKN